jgi:hypothetical protein
VLPPREKQNGRAMKALPYPPQQAAQVPLCGRPAAFPRRRAVDAGGEMEWRVGGRLSPGPGERFVAGRAVASLEM